MKLDSDVVNTQKHIGDAEGKYGSWDLVQVNSDPICSSAGCTQYEHPKAPDGPPMDYPVPNFGQDHEIATSLENEKIASKVVGHEWKFKTPGSWEKWRNPAKDTNYNFNMKLDSDVVNTQKHIGDAEGKYGSWDLTQLNDDPIFSSQGKPKSEYVEKEIAKIV